MKEELTTLMHMEFCIDEKERMELAAHGVFDAVFDRKTMSFAEALKRFGITESEFWENPPYDHVLEFPNKTLEELKKEYINFSKEKHERYKACKSREEIYYLFAGFWNGFSV